MSRPKHLSAVLAAAVALGVLASCGKGPETKGPGSAAAPEKPEKIDLRLRLEPGKTYKLRMDSDQKLIQTRGDSRQESPQTMGSGLSLLVKEVRDDGAAVVQVTYDSLRLKQQGPTGNVDYDSSSPAPAESPHPMAKGFAVLVGQGFSVDLTPKGEVARVDGADQLAARMAENIEVPVPMLRPVMEQQIKQQFGDQAMKEMVEQMVGFRPDEPVAIGGSWSKRIAVTRGFAAILNSTWTLKSHKDGVAVVEVASTVEPNPDAAALDMGFAKLGYTLRGTQNGSLELDESTGWVVRSTVNQSLSGELTMKGGPGGDAAMPISIEGVTRVEGQ